MKPLLAIVLLALLTGCASTGQWSYNQCVSMSTASWERIEQAEGHAWNERVSISFHDQNVGHMIHAWKDSAGRVWVYDPNRATFQAPSWMWRDARSIAAWLFGDNRVKEANFL